MKALSDSLIETIVDLQQLPSLKKSTLGGGTNLAIRYNHRTSYDIDLFFSDIIGKHGYEDIKKEVVSFYGDQIFAIDYPCDEDDQFLFQRFFVRKGETAIKVEILQNMQTHFEPEIINGIKLMNLYDIGSLKLISASNRANHKDIYDLDYLTDHITLNELMELLKTREENYNRQEHQNIFDLDIAYSPIDNPDLLLKFEVPIKGTTSRPGHSNPRIDFIDGEKNWAVARSSWRRKVRTYFKSINRDFPDIHPVDF